MAEPGERCARCGAAIDGMAINGHSELCVDCQIDLQNFEEDSGPPPMSTFDREYRRLTENGWPD